VARHPWALPLQSQQAIGGKPKGLAIRDLNGDGKADRGVDCAFFNLIVGSMLSLIAAPGQI